MGVERTGYNIHVTFGSDPTLVLHCKNVKDSGQDAGDPIDLTTNSTVGARERAPSDLGESTDITLTAAYDLEDRAKLASNVAVIQDISIEYRACSNRAVGRKITYQNAWLNAWDPQEMTEGEQPTIQITIMLPGGTSTGDGSSWNPEGTLTSL